MIVSRASSTVSQEAHGSPDFVPLQSKRDALQEHGAEQTADGTTRPSRTDARRTTCWRCERNPVAIYGLPCPDCRRILEDEYDQRRADNGGKLLYIPDDWDGIRTFTCACGEAFDAVVLARTIVDHLCPRCRREHAQACQKPRRARAGRDEIRISIKGL